MELQCSGEGILAVERDTRDNEFIAELVSLLESHGNDEFKRKHAEIPSLLQQLDVLTQRRKRQEENLMLFNDRVAKLQDLAHCHKEMLDLSKKLVKWLGNGFSSAEILENVRDVKQKAELIERIRANAIRGGRERQVRDALEKLESYRRKVIDGLADLGEGGASLAEEFENSIQALMKKEKAEVEKTKTSCNRLQQEVQKIDDELSNAETELQRAISSAYQSAIKQTAADQPVAQMENRDNSVMDPSRALLLTEDDRRRYEDAMRDHVKAIRELDIEDDCSDVDDSNLSDGDLSTSVSDDHGINTLEKPQQCMKPMIVSSERDNGKLHLKVDLQSSLSESRPESVSFVVETSLEGYRKSTSVKSNLWKVAVPLPNEDATLQIRARAVNAIGLGDFSGVSTLQVEGVRSRKRRLASQKAEADLIAREEEKVRLVDLQAKVQDLRSALQEGDLKKINGTSDETRVHLSNLTSLHSEKKIRASPDAAATLRVARSSIKESEKVEETRKKQTDLLEKVTRLSKETIFDNLSTVVGPNSKLSSSEAERIMSEAEVKATAVCLEWQELINEVNEKGASPVSVKELREHFLKVVIVQAEQCETPPRALGDVLDLAVLKTNVFGTEVEELKAVQSALKKKRESWVKRRDESLAERNNDRVKEPSPKAKKVERKPLLNHPTGQKPKIDEKIPSLSRKRREGHSRSERRQRAAARKADQSESTCRTSTKANTTRLVTPPGSDHGLSPRSVVPISTLSVGKRYRGRVVGIARFGFFVDIGSEKPGLVHISQIREGYISNVHDEVKMLQEVWVRVASLSIEHQNFSCTMRENVDFASATEIFDGPQFDQMQDEMHEESKTKPFSISSSDAWPGLRETQKVTSPIASSSSPRSPQSSHINTRSITPERRSEEATYGVRELVSEFPTRPPSASERSPTPAGENGFYSPFPPLVGLQPSNSPGQRAVYSPFGVPLGHSSSGPPINATEYLGTEARQNGYVSGVPTPSSTGFQPAGFGPFAGGQYSMFGAMTGNTLRRDGNQAYQDSQSTETIQNQLDAEGLDNDIVKSLRL